MRPAEEEGRGGAKLPYLAFTAGHETLQQDSYWPPLSAR